MSHSHTHHITSEKRLSVAFYLNFVFTVVEIIGGIYTNSFAILSDALHDLGDSFSLGLAWYFQKLSKKGRTKDFTYGYRRFSVLGAVINAIVLIVGSVVILSQAIPALWNPHEADAKGMLLLSILGIAFNGIAAWKLRGGSGLNERVVFWHLVEDILGWVAVLIGSIVMIFYDLPFIDPLLSILISVFIIYNVFRNLRKSLNIFLQATPEDISEEMINSRILAVEDVCSVHDCHVWSLDGEFNILTIHVVVKENLDLKKQVELKEKIKKSLKDLRIQHMTLEFETAGQDCEMEDC